MSAISLSLLLSHNRNQSIKIKMMKKWVCSKKQNQAPMPSLFIPCCFFSVAMRDILRCCYSSPSSSSSSVQNEENTASDVDEEQVRVIILAVRSRAMEMKRKPKWDSLKSENLCWEFSERPALLLAGSHSSNSSFHMCFREEEEDVDVFFSVDSKFSPSSHGSMVCFKEWEELISCCEGWPFGLFNKGRGRMLGVLLPPLPSSPSDSWVWREKKS